MSPRTLSPLPCLWKSDLALSGPGVLWREVSLLLSVLQATSGLMTVTVQQEGPPTTQPILAGLCLLCPWSPGALRVVGGALSSP